MKVVILGGSFGGLTTAYELRKRLGPHDCEIVVISKERCFTFIPSLPWVAMGSRTLEQISFDLERPLARRGIALVHSAAERIDPQAQTVIAAGREFAYDRLVIATGHRSANEAVPGLGTIRRPGALADVSRRGR